MNESIMFYEDAIEVPSDSENLPFYWIEDEWVEDPQVVFSIANAIKLHFERSIREILQAYSVAQEQGENDIAELLYALEKLDEKE